ncbi:purine-nucleoside phosphorylase [Faecalicoccus acidiformans]|uniref:Uridine phosphorylase n=1 Tax=Faecalicoccus acidiformans TaxID=915173 RepID=A0A7W8FYP2_9FIRM|nr:purine-nucleoside phosphorylase [Faecalicoccus acidiformans]MBB5184177.1 purine-nucleoside phosphorylase [Faecalicoccus acidiformans]HIW17743.1 purine-nucleoside phosphorylase [Candidatus Faecalicoccus intestinipullorum]
MSTAHNNANLGDIAKTVLMPGDPLRAKHIAETYLTDFVQFNAVRGMYGYTGDYKGKRISVMASGMGMPSMGIYSYELFKEYGVENIIRIGSAGAYTKDLHLFDLVLADSCWSESTFALAQAGIEGNIQYPSQDLNETIKKAAAKLEIPVLEKRIHSSDVFYHEANVPDHNDFYQEHGCVCVEMESYALFHNAKILGKNAACLLTISDSLVTDEHASAMERQTSFSQMMEVALEAAIMR